MTSQAKRPRILVVEDEELIFMLIEDVLTEAGYEVVGPAERVADALAIIERESDIDCALLDVNLRGEKVFPVARALDARKVRFTFLTGGGNDDLHGPHPEALTLMKPFRAPQLLGIIRQMRPDLAPQA